MDAPKWNSKYQVWACVCVAGLKNIFCSHRFGMDMNGCYLHLFAAGGNQFVDLLRRRKS